MVSESGHFIFFHVYIQFYQHHLLKDYIYFIVYILASFVIDHIGVGLFLGSLFCSVDLCVSFYASPMLF